MSREEIIDLFRTLGVVCASMEERHDGEDTVTLNIKAVTEAGLLMLDVVDLLEGDSVEIPIYDEEEIYHGCAVQVLRNSVTGQTSVGWWKEDDDDCNV